MKIVPIEIMKIVPIEIKFKTLYENRHLYTDDNNYNSLIISNLINKKIKLLDVETYKRIDKDYKIKIYNSSGFYNFLLNNTGMLNICLLETRLENGIKLYSWQDIEKHYNNSIPDEAFDILTIVE